MERRLLKAKPKAVALAALYVCESILLELEAAEILTANDVRGLLKDASRSLRQAGAVEKKSKENWTKASEIVDTIREDFDRVRS